MFGAGCVDGFSSQSIGSQGACSHHGGVSKIGGFFALIVSSIFCFILFKCLRVTITNEEIKKIRQEYKNNNYNLKDKICYRCGGSIQSKKYKGDKFPYWACRNISNGKCDSQPIKKFL